MNCPLEALRESIVAEIVAAHPDFDFIIAADRAGNLTSDHRGIWEPEPNPGTFHPPYLTVKHDGECFLVSHYSWADGKRYKTFKGAMKYIAAEIANSCERKRKQKAKDDAEKAFAEKSVQLLRDFHGVLTHSGIEAKLCLTADRHNYDHIHIEAKRIHSGLDIRVERDYRLEIDFCYPHISATPETAVDIVSVLSKGESA